ncbi:MAG: ABC transporter permease [Pleurocapsa minor GSE-CHR-MK-17-07R]|jgi:ABC-2 type transport system permease protein|nr:ABC transporter permease [Pleurocapsa minor GSE-CHR-MK 17-07R]
MKKIWIIAVHEYLGNMKRGGFLFSTFIMPLILIALIALVGYLSAQSAIGSDSDAVGYVDQAGILENAIERPENFSAYASEEEARAALDAGTVSAYFVVLPDYLRSGNVQLYNTGGGTEALNDLIGAYLVANLDIGLPEDVQVRISDPVADMSILTLDSGRIIDESNIFVVFLAPLVFVLVFMISTQASSSYVMSGVVEEKSTRVVEILVTTVRPIELLAGKILGLGALGLTQLGIWIIAIVLFITLGRNTSFLSGFSVPVDLLVTSVVYFILGYFLFASIMAGIGAVIGSEQESRQIAGLLGLPLSLPFFFILSFLTDPNGTAVTILTLFPLTAPVTVILRMGFGTVPPEQVILSIAILAATTVLAVWISARLFRWSILMYGKRPSLRQMIQAVTRNHDMQTTATGDRAG